MKIAASYSHLNGLEFLLVHHAERWSEIRAVIASVDAEKCRTKVSKEKRKGGAMLYSPIAINRAMKSGFGDRGWIEQRTSYWVTGDEKLIRKTIHLTPTEQRAEIEAAGKRPIYSYNQTDFVKDRIAV